MRAVARTYWLKAILVSFAAFLCGAAAYILIGVVIANRAPDASAAHHQISVLPIDCDCVIKFTPERPLSGSGTVDNPYISYSSLVPIVVGVSGTGYITIEDAAGNILFSYDKTERGYGEIIAQINLSDGVGSYELIVKIDGVEKTDDDTDSRIFINYQELPLPPIAPPNTGGHLYIGGYATQTFGVIFIGSIFFAIVFGIFIIGAARRKQRYAEAERRQSRQNRQARRELSPAQLKQFAQPRKKKKS